MGRLVEKVPVIDAVRMFVQKHKNIGGLRNLGRFEKLGIGRVIDIVTVSRKISGIDTPDVRSVLLHYLRDLPCEAEMIVARKIPALFQKQHNGREEEFYADLLAHLVKARLKRAGTLVLNVAERGSSTREKVLTDALKLATERAAKKWGAENLQARAVFNVQNPRTEPLLTVSDYLCWAVQRVFEQGNVRHYNYLAAKIRLVVDLYDREKYTGSRNYYDKKNPLTAENKLGPPVA